MYYKNQKIYKFNRTGPVVIDWMLGNYCNFDCVYCFPGANEGTFKPPKLTDTLLNNLTFLHSQLKTSNNYIYWNFSGGEPTLYKDFSKLIMEVKNISNESMISIVTNGSRPIRWWEENINLINYVVLSFHTERGSIAHFKEVIRSCHDKTKIQLHVILGNQNFKEAYTAAEEFVYFLLDNQYHVNFSIKTIRKTSKNFLFSEMTDEQKQKVILLKEEYQSKKKQLKKTNTGGTEVFLEDENFFLLDATKHILDFNGSWRGYRCFAPTEFIQISESGNLGKMSCGHILFKSNIYEENFIKDYKNFKNGIICSKDHCGCYGLFESSKELLINHE